MSNQEGEKKKIVTGGTALLGLVEYFHDLEEDGVQIPKYIFRHIQKFGKKHKLPPFDYEPS